MMQVTYLRGISFRIALQKLIHVAYPRIKAGVDESYATLVVEYLKCFQIYLVDLCEFQIISK